MLRALKTFIRNSVNYRMSFSGHGHSIKVPVWAGVGRANRDRHEIHVSAVLERLHQRRTGTLLVDIGVNIGQTLIKHFLIVGPEGRYFGFEPNVRSMSYVDELIACNGLKHAQVIPVGLGSSVRLADFFTSTSTSTDPAASINTAFRDPSFYGAKKLVPIFEADTVLEVLGVNEQYFIVKIDVEGAELEVVQGMRKTLEKLRPFVIMEILPPTNFSDGVNKYRLDQAAAIKTFMAEQGYNLSPIGSNGELGHGQETNDYLFIPKEMSGAV